MDSIGSNESEGDGSTAQSHQTAVSPSMGEPENHPAIHPPTHENSEEISTAIDETWDLRSPLMPRLAQDEEQESSSDESNLPLELEEPTEENVAFDPWRVSLMLCAMIMTMLFCGLVTGSFFFPWSDTTFRLQMDTTDSLPFDISVVSVIENTSILMNCNMVRSETMFLICFSCCYTAMCYSLFTQTQSFQTRYPFSSNHTRTCWWF
jgi:hypothetical protein